MNISQLAFVQHIEMQIQIKDVDRLYLAAVRHTGPYDTISRAFGILAELTNGSTLASGPLVAVYYDDPNAAPSAQLHSAAAVVVEPTAKVPSELIEMHVGEGTYATAQHLGSYSKLGQTWEVLLHRCRTDQQVNANEPCFELYRNTPLETSETELVTELFVPLS